MKASITLFLVLWWSAVRLSAQESLPTIQILPGDVVQTSIKQLSAPVGPMGTNRFTVRWTYTEAGAKKMAAFWRAHAGKEAVERVGSYEFRATIQPASTPGWEEGWLNWRTDKFFGVTEDDAKKILAGLRGK